MVSSGCRSGCHTTIQAQPGARALSIDNSKNYMQPLQVETSVEYDLPAHIYPPKGAEPILMIHPAYLTPVRARKVAVTPHSPLYSTPTKPLSTLQIFNKPKTVQSKSICSCGLPNCLPKTRRSSVAKLSINAMTKATENMVSNSTEFKLQQQKIKRKLADQHLQEQLQIQERTKLQALRVEQWQKNRQTLAGQQASEFLAWSVGGRCLGPCCQPRIGSLAPTQAEFLAPGLPPSLVRTPPRGSSSGSPKLRARTRRAIANASTLPEYLGTSRSTRSTSSVSLNGTPLNSHTRSRSSSVLGATPELISALDVVRAHVLTPRSLFMNQKTPGVNSFLDTVGQSRDSGCSIGPDTSTTFNGETPTNRNVEWAWSGVDSGFSTPVDSLEDQIQPMEVFEGTPSSTGKQFSLSSSKESSFPFASNARNRLPWPTDYSSLGTAEIASSRGSAACVPATQLSAAKESASTSLYWMKDQDLSLNSSLGVHNSFFQPSAPHYIPQPIWNLAY